MPLADVVKDYAVRLVLATHPQGEFSVPLAQKFVLYGSSPRGLQSIILAAKARAFFSERPNVSFEDIRAVLMPSLIHRILLNLAGDAEGMTAEKVLEEVLQKVTEAL